MQIVFDQRKRLMNIAKHEGLDFADLDLAFFERSEILPAKQNRLMAIGAFEDEVITVIFCRLGAQGLSVISMRPASIKEKRRHEEVALRNFG